MKDKKWAREKWLFWMPLTFIFVVNLLTIILDGGGLYRANVINIIAVIILAVYHIKYIK